MVFKIKDNLITNQSEWDLGEMEGLAVDIKRARVSATTGDGRREDIGIGGPSPKYKKISQADAKYDAGDERDLSIW